MTKQHLTLSYFTHAHQISWIQILFYIGKYYLLHRTNDRMRCTIALTPKKLHLGRCRHIWHAPVQSPCYQPYVEELPIVRQQLPSAAFRVVLWCQEIVCWIMLLCSLWCVFQRECPCGFQKTYRQVTFPGDFGENIGRHFRSPLAIRICAIHVLQPELQPVDQDSFRLECW